MKSSLSNKSRVEILIVLSMTAVIALPCRVASSASPRFKVHAIEENSPLVNDSVMSCTLVDLDGDGDLDWTAGTVWPRKTRTRTLYWYEHRAPSKWIHHRIGEAPAMYGGACATDVNGDGHADIVATNLWLNKGKETQWSFHKTGIPGGVHDMQAADINGDGRTDFLVFDQSGGLMWFEMQADPAKRWIPHARGNKPMRWREHVIHTGMTVHEGIAGDVDGDGDADIVIKPWNQKDDPKDFLYLQNETPRP